MKMTAGKKSRSKNKALRNIIIIMMAIIIVFVLAIVGLNLRKYATGRSQIKQTQELYNPTPIPDGDKASIDKLIDPETGIIRDFDKLYDVNPDVVGWLAIKGTPLDLPVVKGSDNTYYLNHTLYNKSHAFGIPFADAKATITPDLQSTNVTIYGHAAKDGSYFASVKKFKDISYYKEHPTITFNTIYNMGEYKIIGFFMEDVSASNSKMFAYHDKVDLNEEDFNDYIGNVLMRSYFTTGVDTKFGDHLITLSTCDTEVNNTDFRVVLVARKVRPDESADVDVSVSQKNANQMMPARWYEKKGITNPFAQ